MKRSPASAEFQEQSAAGNGIGCDTRRNCSAPRRVIAGHDWDVLAILLSPDGRTLVSSGADGRVICTDTNTARTAELASGTWSEKDGRYSPALLSADFADRTAASDCYLDLAWIEPGKSFVAVSQSGRACMWELPAADPRTIATTGDCLTCVASSHADAAILFGSRHGRLFLIDETGRELATREVSDIEITDITSLPIGWAVAQSDGSVRILSRNLSDELAQWSEKGTVFGLEYCATTRQLAIAADTQAIAIVKLATDGAETVDRRTVAMPSDINARPVAPHSLRWNDDGTMLLAGDSHGRLIAWDADTCACDSAGRIRRRQVGRHPTRLVRKPREQQLRLPLTPTSESTRPDATAPSSSGTPTRYRA